VKYLLRFCALFLTLGLLASTLQAERDGRRRMLWIDDVQKAIDLAHKKDVPLLLLVADTFGAEFVREAASRWSWGDDLEDQLRFSGARWRWQRYQDQVFTDPELIKTAEPFIAARLITGYRMNPKGRQLLVRLRLLTDVDLAWRERLRILVRDPWVRRFVGYDVFGFPSYQSVWTLDTSLEELLDREATAVVVLAADGKPLAVMPDLLTARELAAELRAVITPYRVLAEARHYAKEGQISDAVNLLRRLAREKETVPEEVRLLAQTELEELAERAAKTIGRMQRLLNGKDYESAWKLLSESREQKLRDIGPAVARQLDLMETAVAEHAQELYATARRELEKKQFLQALKTLNHVLHSFAGTPAEGQADLLLKHLEENPELAEQVRAARRRAEAQALLEAATEAEKTGDLLAAHNAFKMLAEGFGDLEAGTKAREQLAAWQADAEVTARIHELRVRKEADHWMSLARNYFANGLYSQAIDNYRKVVKEYPGTEVAGEARARIEQARRLLEEKYTADPQGPAGDREPERQDKP